MKQGRFGVQFHFSNGDPLTITLNTIEEEGALVTRTLTSNERFAALDTTDGTTTIINPAFVMWCRSVRT